MLKVAGVVLQILGVLYIAEKLLLGYLIGSSGDLPTFSESQWHDSSHQVAVVSPTSGRGYPDAAMAEFNQKVLTAMGIEHTVGTYDDIHSVSWDRQDDDVEEEIEARISQYRFIRDVCPRLPLPMPEEPSKKKLSCSSPMPDWYEPQGSRSE